MLPGTSALSNVWNRLDLWCRYVIRLTSLLKLVKNILNIFLLFYKLRTTVPDFYESALSKKSSMLCIATALYRNIWQTSQRKRNKKSHPVRASNFPSNIKRIQKGSDLA